MLTGKPPLLIRHLFILPIRDLRNDTIQIDYADARGRLLTRWFHVSKGAKHVELSLIVFSFPSSPSLYRSVSLIFLPYHLEE